MVTHHLLLPPCGRQDVPSVLRRHSFVSISPLETFLNLQYPLAPHLFTILLPPLPSLPHSLTHSSLPPSLPPSPIFSSDPQTSDIPWTISLPLLFSSATTQHSSVIPPSIPHSLSSLSLSPAFIFPMDLMVCLFQQRVRLVNDGQRWSTMVNDGQQ